MKLPGCHSLGRRRGGTASTSPFERTALEIIQKNGKRKEIAAAATATCRAALPAPRCQLTTRTSAIVVHPLALQAKLYGGQRHDDDEQDPGDRRGVAEVIADEAVAVDLVAERLGGGTGAAARERVDLVEDLQAGDRGEHDPEEEGGRDQRQLDPPEALPAGGAI